MSLQLPFEHRQEDWQELATTVIHVEKQEVRSKAEMQQTNSKSHITSLFERSGNMYIL